MLAGVEDSIEASSEGWIEGQELVETKEPSVGQNRARHGDAHGPIERGDEVVGCEVADREIGIEPCQARVETPLEVGDAG